MRKRSGRFLLMAALLVTAAWSWPWEGGEKDWTSQDPAYTNGPHQVIADAPEKMGATDVEAQQCWAPPANYRFVGSMAIVIDQDSVNNCGAAAGTRWIVGTPTPESICVHVGTQKACKAHATISAHLAGPIIPASQWKNSVGAEVCLGKGPAKACVKMATSNK